MFSFFLFAFIFWEKECFFASFLNNLLFFSSYKPLFFLHLFLFLFLSSGLSSPWFFYLTLVFHLPFSFPFFSLISSFFFFEHRSFLVPFFLPSGYNCSWFLFVLNFFGRFLHLQFFCFLNQKKTFVFETSHHSLRCLKKKLTTFRKCFWYLIVFHISFVFNSCISYFVTSSALDRIFFFERFFGWSSFFFGFFVF